MSNGPVLHMWSTGELKREFRHVGGNEAMVIRRPLWEATGRSVPAVILLRNMHIYYPVDEEEFQQNTPIYVALALGHLKLPEGYSGKDLEKTIRKFVDYVQDGFDELKKMKPQEQSKQVVGEVTGYVDGMRICQEVVQ